MPITVTDAHAGIRETSPESRFTVPVAAWRTALVLTEFVLPRMQGIVQDYALAHLKLSLSLESVRLDATDRIRAARVIVPVTDVTRVDAAVEAYVKSDDLPRLRDRLTITGRTVTVTIKDRAVILDAVGSLATASFASEYRNVLTYPDLVALLRVPRESVANATVTRRHLRVALARCVQLAERLYPEDGYCAAVVAITKNRLRLQIGQLPVGRCPATTTLNGTRPQRRTINARLALEWVTKLDRLGAGHVTVQLGSGPVRLVSMTPRATFALAPLTGGG